MDSELMAGIDEFVSANPVVRRLEQAQADDLASRVAERFGFVQAKRWWWETTVKPLFTVTYSGEEGLKLLLELIPDLEQTVFMFATDDETPPWPCIAAPAPVLVDLLREQRFFEYFVLDPELRWVVFDTHHNMLVGFGEGLSPDRGHAAGRR